MGVDERFHRLHLLFLRIPVGTGLADFVLIDRNVCSCAHFVNIMLFIALWEYLEDVRLGFWDMTPFLNGPG
jgi:hypothetical protein